MTDSSQGLANYGAILSGDVFVYIGNLVEIFAGVALRLQQDGHFIFSVERLEKAILSFSQLADMRTAKSILMDWQMGLGFLLKALQISFRVWMETLK